MTQTKLKGIGLGLRFPHFDEIIRDRPKVPWFEVVVEDFLEEGPHHQKLLELRKHYPIVMHSVSLNVGGVDPFDPDTLSQIKELYDKFEPHQISDHLCWSTHNGNFHHDLLPIPRTQEGLEHVVKRTQSLQEHFGKSISLENITYYEELGDSELSESEFINELVKKAGCNLLLDVSNVLINAQNHSFSAQDFCESLPLESVNQIHLAGGIEKYGLRVDSHSTTVASDDVGFLASLIEKGLDAPAMLERDHDLPSFSELESERQSIEANLGGVF